MILTDKCGCRSVYIFILQTVAEDLIKNYVFSLYELIALKAHFCWFIMTIGPTSKLTHGWTTDTRFILLTQVLRENVSKCNIMCTKLSRRSSKTQYTWKARYCWLQKSSSLYSGQGDRNNSRILLTFKLCPYMFTAIPSGRHLPTHLKVSWCKGAGYAFIFLLQYVMRTKGWNFVQILQEIFLKAFTFNSSGVWTLDLACWIKVSSVLTLHINLI